MIIISTNEDVTFRPTSSGRRIIDLNYKESFQQNDDGTVTVELWRFIQCFGASYCRPNNMEQLVVGDELVFG